MKNLLGRLKRKDYIEVTYTLTKKIDVEIAVGGKNAPMEDGGPPTYFLAFRFEERPPGIDVVAEEEAYIPNALFQQLVRLATNKGYKLIEDSIMYYNEEKNSLEIESTKIENFSY